MDELRSHSSERTPTPRTILLQEKLIPVVSKLKEAYLAWQAALPHVAKAKRQTIAARIDGALLDTLESTFSAAYLPPIRKMLALESAVARLDTAKFLLMIGWESGAITNSQYTRITDTLAGASKMLVGWRAYLEKKTPANGSERK